MTGPFDDKKLNQFWTLTPATIATGTIDAEEAF
jgi:hypothetical protein